MIQFITFKNDTYSVPEQVQMALEAGCRWIQLDCDSVLDSSFRETATEVVDLCREHEAFLVIKGDMDVARELGVHGIVLRHEISKIKEARELLGAEAIIGVEVHNAKEIESLNGIDVDYVMLGKYGSKEHELSLCDYTCIIDAVRTNGVELPVVAYGEFGIKEIESLLACHVNGIAISSDILSSPDPVAYVSEIMQLTKR